MIIKALQQTAAAMLFSASSLSLSAAAAAERVVRPQVTMSKKLARSLAPHFPRFAELLVPCSLGLSIRSFTSSRL